MKTWCANLAYYPAICLDRLRKITRKLSENGRKPTLDLNTTPKTQRQIYAYLSENR